MSNRVGNAVARLTAEDLPGIYRSADIASLEGQRSYLRWTKVRLTVLLVAAIAGTAITVESVSGGLFTAFGLVTVIAFVLALVVELLLLTSRPEEAWYHGRAVAESIKSLAWCYMMQAEPFPASITNPEADKILLERLRRILEESPICPDLPPSNGPEVTEKMRQVRNASFADKKQTYLTDRVIDQREWYKKKAIQNTRNAQSWRITLLALESLGGVMAILHLTRLLDIGLEGAIAACVAAAGAWIEVKQFGNLASAYGLTATDLSLVEADGRNTSDEAGLSAYVKVAEQAISREHTMWLARRTKPRLGGRST